MNNELKPKDIPEDLIQLIRDNFENYPKVKEMRAQQEVAKRRFDLPTVKAIEDKLEHLFAVTLTNYLDAVNNEAEQLNTEAIGLTAKEKKRDRRATCNAAHVLRPYRDGYNGDK